MFLKFIAPRLFPEFILGPEPTDQFDLWRPIALFYDRDDIVTKFDVLDPEYPPVNAGSADYLPLFAEIDRGESRFDFLGAARFYLDKTQDIVIQRDQIDLARYLNSDAVSSDRDPEIGSNETEAFSFEISGS
jgi:hypothetical protein